jgi:hypothetical protein
MQIIINSNLVVVIYHKPSLVGREIVQINWNLDIVDLIAKITIRIIKFITIDRNSSLELEIKIIHKYSIKIIKIQTINQ